MRFNFPLFLTWLRIGAIPVFVAVLYVPGVGFQGPDPSPLGRLSWGGAVLRLAIMADR